MADKADTPTKQYRSVVLAERVTVRLTTPQREAIRSYAAKIGVDESDAIRALLLLALNQVGVFHD